LTTRARRRARAARSQRVETARRDDGATTDATRANDARERRRRRRRRRAAVRFCVGTVERCDETARPTATRDGDDESHAYANLLSDGRRSAMDA